MRILDRIIKYFYKKPEYKLPEHAKETSSDEKIFGELKELIQPCLNRHYENTEILPSYRFDDILIDSLTGIELIIDMEEKYDLQIPDEDFQKCETVEDAVKYIHNALQTKCASQNKEK